VDGGTGCFVDELAVACLAPDQERFGDAMQELSATGGQWSMDAFLAAMPPVLRQLYRGQQRGEPAILDPETGANLVAFPSGIGDGCYASYFGLTAAGESAWLVTDFGLLIRSVDGRLELPAPVREHSELTHPDLTYIGVECIRVDWNPTTGEVTIQAGEALHLQSLRFENRPGQGLAGSSQGTTYWYHLEEPLQPTARVVIEYTLRTEAL
jgi:hypothetical protein